MEFSFTEAQRRFREEVRAFARREVTPALFAEMEQCGTEHHAGFHARLAEQGWIGLHWPPAYGGLGLDHLHTTIFYEELEYAFAPISRYRTSVAFVGQSVLAFGSERQKEYFLPRIARGELTGVWMLTEPDAGSDAAALRLRARPDGDDWILEGEKIFTSGAQDADYGLVAARSDLTTHSRHEGISLFLVPLRSPGLTIRPIRTIGGWSVNQEIFDGVRVPGWLLVGEANQGWRNLARYTLNFERAGIARTGTLLRLSDELARLLNSGALFAARELRWRLAELRAEIVAARWLGYRVAWLYDQGRVPAAESSMVKLLTAELLGRLADLGAEILGPAALVRGPEAPLHGRIEFHLRSIWFHLVGGGTPDIQRNVIAQMGLGLPRELVAKG
ncbi:MAG: acyl-CoA dehydrogenase family protein [Burkholderiaceae bacterium]|nr:acyl-CoA dehydrogenase family protein [Burkholderiaceae bacterium]